MYSLRIQSTDIFSYRNQQTIIMIKETDIRYSREEYDNRTSKYPFPQSLRAKIGILFTYYYKSCCCYQWMEGKQEYLYP